MCLAIPAKVEKILDGDQAMISVGGVEKEISLALVENIQEGDYVIVHVGYAINTIDPEEAEKTLAMFAQLGTDLEASL